MRCMVFTCFTLIFLFIGCQTSTEEMTEDQAKKAVREEHASRHGDVEILSVDTTEDKFIILWEIDPIEHGKESIDRKNGELKIIESSSGPCKWK